MPKTFIPLEIALADARHGDNLLEQLRAGEIEAYAAVSNHAGLGEWCTVSTLEAFVEKIFATSEEIKRAVEHLANQSSGVRYVWASNNYYAVTRQHHKYVVYSDTMFRKPYRRTEIERLMRRHSYIDEDRWVVVYDNFEDWYRLEFMHVHLDEAACKRIRRDIHESKSTSVGRRSMYKQEIADFARHLCKNDRPSLKKDFIKAIQKEFGKLKAGSGNTIDTHYGDIYRESE